MRKRTRTSLSNIGMRALLSRIHLIFRDTVAGTKTGMRLIGLWTNGPSTSRNSTARHVRHGWEGPLLVICASWTYNSGQNVWYTWRLLTVSPFPLPIRCWINVLKVSPFEQHFMGWRGKGHEKGAAFVIDQFRSDNENSQFSEGTTCFWPGPGFSKPD